jgi:endonuclease/exonuclease/phosphatase family metal-dependent hydrolase
MQMANADIICLQEFFECYDPKISDQNILAIKKMGYSYHYFFPSSIVYEGNFQFGLCIFSRFPIADSARFLNGAGAHSEGFSYVDLKIKENTVRVFNTHLESVGFSRHDYETLGDIENTGNIFRKIRASYELRNLQASTLSSYIKASPHPVIVCGDIDDVPNSYAYFRVKGDKKDVFLERGAGLGRTYQFISPSLRIDYIFADKKMRVRQSATLQPVYSDHYPILADIEIPQKR